MGANTKIEYAAATLNFWTGCEPVSEGCENCFAARGMRRFGRDPHERKRVSEKTINKTLRAAKPGDIIFVNSWSDFFDPVVPLQWVEDAHLIMRLHRDLTFLLLTKRPEHINGRLKMAVDTGPEWMQHNWLGVTAENQARADERIPKLFDIDWPGKKFVSIEPTLGPVVLKKGWLSPGYERWCEGHPESPEPKRPGGFGRWMPHLDWVIAGGESGPGARPAHPEWFRSLRDQCVDEGVPFFFKQWGEWAPLSWNERVELEFDPPKKAIGSWRGDEFAPGECGTHLQNMTRVGKKKAGRILDGKLWDEVPG